MTVIASNHELAENLGVGESSVRRWRQRRTWPFGGPPWSRDLLGAIAKWANATVRIPAHAPPVPPQPLHWTWPRVAESLITWWGAVPGDMTVDDLTWLADSWNAVLDYVIDTTGPIDFAANPEQERLLSNGLSSAAAELMTRRFGKNHKKWPIPNDTV